MHWGLGTGVAMSNFDGSIFYEKKFVFSVKLSFIRIIGKQMGKHISHFSPIYKNKIGNFSINFLMDERIFYIKKKVKAIYIGLGALTFCQISTYNICTKTTYTRKQNNNQLLCLFKILAFKEKELE